MDCSLKNGKYNEYLTGAFTRTPNNMQSLLKKLITSPEEDKVKCLQLLGKLIFQNSKLKDEFLEAGGTSIVLNYLNHSNPAIVGTAYHVLGFSLDGNQYEKRRLSTLNIFSVLKKHLKGSLRFLTKCALFLTATIVGGNDFGQTVARESGCLYYLVKIFYSNIQPVHSQVTEEELTYWTFVCPALKACIENPPNLLNQHQAALIIPKAVAFLENWFQLLSDKYLAEKTELLVSVLVSILRENENNQLGFAAYSGLRWIIRGLQALAGWQSMPNNVDTLRDKLVALLAAAVEKNPSNCEESTSYGAIPLLLFILVNAKDKYKLRPLLALTHLVHNCSKSKGEFLQENGIASVVKATVNSETFPDTTIAAKRLLKYCAADVAQLTLHQSNTKSNNAAEINTDMPCSSELADICDLVEEKNGRESTIKKVPYTVHASKSTTNKVPDTDHTSKLNSNLESNDKQAKNTEVKNCSFITPKHVKIKNHLLCANCNACSSSNQSSHRLQNTFKQRQYSGRFSDASSSFSSIVSSSSKNNNSGQIRERFSRLHLHSAERESSRKRRSKGVFCDEQKIHENTNLKLRKVDLISQKQPCCTIHTSAAEQSFIQTTDESLHNEIQRNSSEMPHGKRISESLTEGFHVTPEETSTEQQTELMQYCDNVTNKEGVKAQQIITTHSRVHSDTCESFKCFHLKSALCRQATQNQKEKLQRHIQKHCGFKYIKEISQNASNYTSSRNQNDANMKYNKNRLSKTSQSDTEMCFKKPHQVITPLKAHLKSDKKDTQELNFAQSFCQSQVPLKRKYIELSSTASKLHCFSREISNGKCNISECFQNWPNKVRRFRNCQSDIEATCFKNNKQLAQRLFKEMSSKRNSDYEDSNTESVVSDTIKNKIKELHNSKYKAIHLKRMLQTMQSESQNAKIERYLNSFSNATKEFDAEENRGYFVNSSDPMAFVAVPANVDAQSVQPSSRLDAAQQSLKDVDISHPLGTKECNENSIAKPYEVAKTTCSLNNTQEHAAQTIDYISNNANIEHENLHSFSKNQNMDVSTVLEADVQESDAFKCGTASTNSAETETRVVDKEEHFPESVNLTDKNMRRDMTQAVVYSEIQNTDDNIVEQLLKNISLTTKEYTNNCNPTSTYKSPESTKWFTPQESISPEVQLKELEKIYDQENHSIYSQMHDNNDECSVAMTPAFPCSFEASQRCFSEPIQTPLSHRKKSTIPRKQLFPAQTNDIHPNQHKMLELEKRKEIMSDSIIQERPMTLCKDKSSVQGQEAASNKLLTDENFPSSSEKSCLSQSRMQMKRRRTGNKHYRLLKYTESELQNLISGVQKYGKDFKVSTMDKSIKYLPVEQMNFSAG